MENRYIILVVDKYDLQLSDDCTIYVDYYDYQSNFNTYGYYGTDIEINTNLCTEKIEECKVYIYKNSVKTNCLNSYVKQGKICFCN